MFSPTTNLYFNPFPVGHIYCVLASPYRAVRICHAVNIPPIMHKYEQFPPAALCQEKLFITATDPNCLKQGSQTQIKCK